MRLIRLVNCAIGNCTIASFPEVYRLDFIYKSCSDYYPQAGITFKDEHFLDFLNLPEKHSENKLYEPDFDCRIQEETDSAGNGPEIAWRILRLI